MDYFSRKSLSKYLMNTIEFNKHDVDKGGTIRHCATGNDDRNYFQPSKLLINFVLNPVT
jgi:hypothetical protein